MRFGEVLTALSRQKTLPEESIAVSDLKRCLKVFDLVMLGVGSTLGLGVYVLAGQVAKTNSGPAVVLAFLVAAVASGFAAVCYAEFAARVPKAGSAYVYSYVCIGELVAFIIGWNLVLEYVIGTASVARGFSAYIDRLFNKTMENTLREKMAMGVAFLSPYPDFLSFGIVIFITALLAFGVKESSIFNNIFTSLNLLVIVTVIISGSIIADPGNWNIDKSDIPDEYKDQAGEGGFFPFGAQGIIRGAAKCFYGFVGFDAIATTGEEAVNPRKSIPIALGIALCIIFAAYFSISTVLTMMLPYYEQDPDAPFPHAYEAVGWPVLMWIVTIGAVIALSTSLLGAMFPLPRVAYSMATDGIIFRFLASIHPRTKTPFIATILAGLLAGIMAALVDLENLIEMMSIGTLLAYTVVAVCVLILRYEDPVLDLEDNSRGERLSIRVLKQSLNVHDITKPTLLSSRITKCFFVLYSILCIIFSLLLIHLMDLYARGEPWLITITVLLFLIMTFLIIMIARQPVTSVELSFKVPGLPYVPALSVLINVYLMLVLEAQTWVRFSIWMIVGFIIYFSYGISHSTERKYDEVPVPEN